MKRSKVNGPRRAGFETDKNKDLIRRWIAFANAGFAGSFDQFISADYVGHVGATEMDRSDSTGTYAGGLLLLSAVGFIAMLIVLALGYDRSLERVPKAI